MSQVSSKPPATFMGGSVSPDLTKTKSTLPVQLQQPSTINQKQEISNQQMNDLSTVAMFTAVGHVGLHLVVRPLIRKALRSFIFKPKSYNNNNITNNNKNDKNEDKLKRTKSKSKLLSENISGFSGPYGEIVCTFSTLAGITYLSYPDNILIYFGMTYPSLPFILRAIDTLNNSKQKITFKRSLRLFGKGIFVTMGFGLSMAAVGQYFQLLPFFNIFVLSFWDSLTDCILSDGPNS